MSADVSTFDGARKALDSTLGQTDSSSRSVGRIPDAVYCCAGGAKPGFFVEQTEQDFAQGIKTVYMTALCTSHVSVNEEFTLSYSLTLYLYAQAATRLFVKQGKKDAKIVLVSSTVGLMGIVGYTQYAPMKFAIRGKCIISSIEDL